MDDPAQKKKELTARDVAETMAQNMAANMADPNFEADNDRIMDEAARKVLAARQKRLEKNQETSNGE